MPCWGCTVMIRHNFFRLAAQAIVCFACASAPGAPDPLVVYRSPGATRKVFVPKGAAAPVPGAGVRVVADYGAFTVVEMPDRQAASLAAAGVVTLRDEQNLVLLNTGPIDTKAPAAMALMTRQVIGNEPAVHLVQFAGPVKDQWLASLEKTGVKVVQPIPFNAYAVYGTPEQIARVRDLSNSEPYVQWDGDYLAEYKVQPGAMDATREMPDGFVIQVVDDGSGNRVTRSLIDASKTADIRPEARILAFANFTVRMDPVLVDDIAARPDVFAVLAYHPRKMQDEVQGLLMANQTGGLTTSTGYLNFLASRSFPTTPASYPIVCIVDDGIDTGGTNTADPAFHEAGLTTAPSRMVFNAKCTGDATANAVGGHGHMNAGIVGGYDIRTGAPYRDALDYNRGMGISPFGRVAGLKIFNNGGSYDVGTCGGTDAGVAGRVYDLGANLSSNSWGSNVGGAYDDSCQAYDLLTRDVSASTAGNQQMLHIVSAGNSGPGANTVGSPGGAKNVISVGAVENVRDNGVGDGCGVTDANNVNDIAGFSSRGPCDDGRVKPDLVAPGTHVQSAASPDPAYDGSGVCDKYYPAGQTIFAWSSGTSHSCPAVAGAASLAWNWFLRNGRPNPSPALTKALLVGTGRYLAGSGTGGTLPSNSQGFGFADTDRAFDDAKRLFLDQERVFHDSGEVYTTFTKVSDTARPTRVTLAWTDAPGPLSGSAFVNNLDLEVTVGGVSYKGNVFSGGTSTPGGTADVRNNVENIFLPPGTTGTLLIRVVATGISGDAIPANGDATDQDFALSLYNQEPAPPTPIAVSAGTTLTAESCAPADGLIGPQETVTVQFGIANAGSAPFTGLIATLETTGGVTAPSGAQVYGAIPADGSVVARPFTFTANAACDGVIHAILRLSDGGTEVGTAAYDFPVTPRDRFTIESADFANTAPLTIPSSGKAAPYPSEITVSGLSGTIDQAVVSIRGYSHTYPGDVGMLLVGPGGQSVALLSRIGGGTDVVNANLTFSDLAAGSVPTPVVSGTYRPTQGATSLTFPAPAPGAPYGTALSAFRGTSPNGTWKLYVTDAATPDSGQISGGWSIAFQSNISICCGAEYPPLVKGAGYQLVDEEIADGIIDQGESVTLALSLANVGTQAATDIVGTFVASAQFTPAAPSLDYGAMPPFGAVITRNVSLTANAGCGTTMTVSMNLADNGTTDCGNVKFLVPMCTRLRPAPRFQSSGTTLTAESCAPANGAIEPLETVTVAFGLRNTGTLDANNVTATILATGGVMPLTKDRFYGTIAAGGPANEQPFEFLALGDCGSTIAATLRITDETHVLGYVTTVFRLGTRYVDPVTTVAVAASNAATITIPNSGSATPYPSPIEIPPGSGVVRRATVTLNNLSHTYPSDVSVLLVGPQGQSALLMAGAGDGNDVTNAVLTFDDEATSSLPPSSGVITPGTYKPTSHIGYSTALNAPAPAPPYGATLSAFNGTDPVGQWRLFVVDRFSGDSGSISGGWTLSLEVNPALSICCGDGQNQPPSVTVPGSWSAAEDTDSTITGVSVTDPDMGPADTMITTVTARHGILTLGGLVGRQVTCEGTLAGTNAMLGALVYHSDIGYLTDEAVTVLVGDNGFTGAGGPRYDQKSFPVRVVHTNLPPVLTVPGGLTVPEDGAVAVPCGVSDPDALTSPIQTRIVANAGHLTLGSPAGLTFVEGSNGSSRLAFQATQAAAAAALATLVYSPALHQHGPDTITLTANDLGANGTGGEKTTTETVGITVTPVANPPAATLAQTALHFNGTNHVVVPRADGRLDLGGETSITLEAWVRLDVLSPPDGFQILACKGISNGAWNANYCLGAADGILFFYYNNYAGAGVQWNSSSPVLTVGPWYHVAVCDNFSLSQTPVLYVNGAAVPGGWSVAPTVRAPFVSDDPVMIGACLPSGYTEPIDHLFGDIDEVRLWNRTFEAGEIQQMMRTRVAGNEPGLRALWRLDEGRQTAVADSAGENHGFAVGLPDWVLSGAGIDHVKTVQYTDVVVALGGVDFDFDIPLTAFVTKPPTTGSLYQCAGGGRGAPITVPGTAVTDPQHRVVYSPREFGPAIPFDAFRYAVADNETLSESTTVTVNVYPLSETPPFSEITLSDSQPAGNRAPTKVTRHTAVTVAFDHPPSTGTAQWLELSEDPGFTTPTVFVYEAKTTVPFVISSGDGPKAVHARLRSAAFGPGAATTGTIVLDQASPSAAIAPVVPNPRFTPVTGVDITFTEPVFDFGPGSLSLTRNGGPNLLPGGSSLQTTDSVHFSLTGLSPITVPPGGFELALAPAGIVDEAGNPMAAPASTGWTAHSVDLVLTKADTPDPVHAANPLTYTLGVRNTGTTEATGVTLVDTLTTTVQFMSVQATQGSVGYADGVVTASLGTLAADGRATVTVVVLPRTLGSDAVPASWQVTNAAQVFADQDDSYPPDNTAVAHTTVLPMSAYSADHLTTSAHWQQYLQDPPVGDVSYGNLTQLEFDGANTALRARISGDPGTATTSGVAGLFRAAGWRTTDAYALATLPYASVGTGNIVRSKWFVYTTGSVPAATNMIPATRVQLYNRTVVGTTLEIFTHKNDGTAGISGDELGAEIRPASDPASPSVYRCDYDPVDVPFLLANAATESIGRGFLAQSEQTQDNGVIGLGEVITSVYPKSLAAGALIQTLAPTASDAGGLKTTGVTAPDGTGGPSRLRFIYPFIGAGRIGIADFSGGPDISEGAAGVTMDSAAFNNMPSGGLPTRAGIALLGFYPGDDYAARPRVMPGRQYRVRFHVTGTRASNLQAGLRLQAVTGNFTYSQKFEISGSTAGGAQAQTMLAQTQPGTGCLNPDKKTTENGGYYDVLVYTPLSPAVRPENPALTVQERVPSWFAFAGRGVNDLGTLYGGATPAGLNRRDLRLFAALLDTLTFSGGAVNEAGNYTIDEIRVYEAEAVDDGTP